MRTREKQELVRLLHLYMDDLIADNDNNIAERRKRISKEEWSMAYKAGLKAQYEHARIIATKLSVEIGKEIKSYLELL